MPNLNLLQQSVKEIKILSKKITASGQTTNIPTHMKLVVQIDKYYQSRTIAIPFSKHPV